MFIRCDHQNTEVVNKVLYHHHLPYSYSVQHGTLGQIIQESLANAKVNARQHCVYMVSLKRW